MKEDVHSGHRDRLRNKFLIHGIDIFEPHEIIELILFYAIPRKDTNKLAHNLLKQFGSISAMLESPISVLKTISGLSDKGACFVKLLLELVRIYSEEKEVIPAVNPTREHFSDKLSKKFIGRREEVVAMILLDSKKRILYEGIVNTGTFNSVEIHIRKIIELIVVFDAAGILIAHNHPSGIAMPSREDICTTKKLISIFDAMNIELIDHIIVADDDYISLRDCRELCLFEEY